MKLMRFAEAALADFEACAKNYDKPKN